MSGFGEWTYSTDDYVDKGGCAIIYRCYHKRHADKPFAIKVYKRKTSFNMLEREVSILKALASVPNTPTMLDHGIDEQGRICIVQELIPGDSLDRYIRDNGPLSFEQTCHLVEKVLEALKGAHQLGIVHLDIKPGNIMVDGPNITLLDWGLSLERGSRITDAFGGNDYYAPPEVYRAEFSPASDFYALAWIINYCFTKKRPYRFNDIEDDNYIPVAHCLQQPEITDAVPDALHPLIYQWLNKAPQKRQICYELDEAIRLASGSPSDFEEAKSIEEIESSTRYLEYGAKAAVPYCQLKYAEALKEQKNILEAGYWLYCAHNQKYIPATNAIIKQRVSDEGLHSTSEATRSLLLYAAKNRDYRSTCHLARIYIKLNDQQKILEIKELLQTAADDGFSDAQYLLAKALLLILNEPSQAKRYFTQAAQRGHESAQKMLKSNTFRKALKPNSHSIALPI